MQLHELTPGLYRISKTIPNPRIDGRSNDWRLQKNFPAGALVRCVFRKLELDPVEGLERASAAIFLYPHRNNGCWIGPSNPYHYGTDFPDQYRMTLGWRKTVNGIHKFVPLGGLRDSRDVRQAEQLLEVLEPFPHGEHTFDDVVRLHDISWSHIGEFCTRGMDLAGFELLCKQVEEHEHKGMHEDQNE